MKTFRLILGLILRCIVFVTPLFILSGFTVYYRVPMFHALAIYALYLLFFYPRWKELCFTKNL